jgi:Skp family chaperone for outer membrane proteins
MKKILFILSLFLLTINNSFAQKSNLNIAIINVKEVLGNSLAMQKLQKKLQQKEEIYQK